MTEGAVTFAYDSLESIRKRLLDLSSRNALLNYKFPRGKCLQFIETTPNAVFKALSDKKTIDLASIPKPTDAEIKAYYQSEGKKDNNLKDLTPTAESWAKHLGYQTSFDLQQNDFCTSIHTDSDCLQSLLYPKDLETRIKHIKQQAESSLSETGSNVLYIAIGFLEWAESKDSSMRRLAPLFTLPVKIEKKSKTKNGGYDSFEISLLDDGLLSNVTLHEKLKNEFGLELPLLDEDIAPEEYFNLIEQNILAHEKGWKIQRKACMCLLNFTKQAMYQDLEPSIWPESHSIEQHPVIQQLFSKVAKEKENHSFDIEYEIDEIADINEKFPIIYDADSSQHSALIDAVKGENLVIEGPPGSGKSQTITNLIAAAINNGKKVLFVAEKMAALNVVKDRLDKADLGGFCLELHSHKSNKLKILNDLSDQYKKIGQYTKPNQLQVTKNKLDLYKSNLNQYVKSVNKEWGATKLTAHEILAKSAKLKILLDINPEEVLIDNLNISALSQDEIYSYIDCGRLLENAFIQTRDQSIDKNIFKHYWFGVNKINLIDSDKVEIINSLKQWNTELKSIKSLITEVFSIDDFNLEYVEKIVVNANKLPECDEEISYELIHQLISKIDILEEYINLYSTINKNYIEISSTFDEKFLENLDIQQINDIQDLINKSNKLDKIISFNELVEAIDRLENIRKSLIDLSPDIELVKNNIPYELKSVFGYSEEKFKDMELLVTHLKSLPFEWLCCTKIS
ncbi:DUF4011 domain-containing protein [Acinetobacter pittii]|jgi:energy-coupling factor transporter ATP-binding protein EcfA2|uniref:DUF4011 domain-containing protein n=1 Tax=Acinetobacter pittii TaxID=48296 RepID=UPI00029DE81C|nr:DUF4011 domain-containing protein [Acinetobacter pittii]EKU67440.1 PF13195 family protein [Acinetobacter pittii]KAI0678076.1 DUF4011 domain-containing protein [Acinetobacter pittii]KRJ07336.1 hypothetical protein APC76_12075 [Acinetobacter pittii]MBA0123681.1 DUF4011 domain-containing protein [Acinetobacter pittii]MBA0131788.1 DUF4011 domain-containing protein [Acinetobacter pittii]